MDKIESKNRRSLEAKIFLALILRHWYLFVIFLIASLCFAWFQVRYSQKIYSVQSSLYIKDDKGKKLGPESFIEGMELLNSHKDVLDEIEVVKSYELINAAVKALHFEVSYFKKGTITEGEIYKTAPFRVILDTTFDQKLRVPFFVKFTSDSTFSISARKPLDSGDNGTKNHIINGVLGEPCKSELFSIIIFPNQNKLSELSKVDDDDYYFIINDLIDVSKNYLTKLKIAPIHKSSNILTLTVNGPVPEKEIDFLNKISELYINKGLEEKNKTVSNTINFIDNQLILISDSLKGAEKQLESFQTTNKIMDVRTIAQNTYQQLIALEEKQAVLKVQDKYYNYLLDYLLNNYDFSQLTAPSTVGISDPLLTNLINELYTLHSEQVSLGYSAKEKNPTFSILEVKIKNTKKALVENVKNLIESSRIGLNENEERVNKLRGIIGQLPSHERNLVDIQRKFNLNDHIYNYLLEKRIEASIAKAANVPDHKVLTKPMLFGLNPILPDAKKIYSLAFLFGIFFPALIIFVKEYMNDSIPDKKTIERKTKTPIIGEVGHYNGKLKIPIIESPKSLVSESIRSLRVNLQYLATEKTRKIIGITSSISGEGKTFFAINLAASLAISGAKVLVMGTDLRKPKIHKYMNISNEKGLTNYLINAASLEEIIFHSDIQNLDVINSGPIPPNPTELLEKPLFKSLLDHLSLEYDYIIIDAPPVGLVADYYIIANFVDANLFMIRHEYTKISLLDEIENIYSQKKLNNLFIVFNDIKSKFGPYLYGYGYGYGYSGGYGYYEDGNSDIKGKIIKLLPFTKKLLGK